MKKLLLTLTGIAICLNSFSQDEGAQQISGNVLLTNHTITTYVADVSGLQYSSNEVVDGKIYRLVQASGLKLHQQYPGFTTLEYIPHKAFIVSINVYQLETARQFLVARGASVTALQPDWKLSKKLFQKDVPHWAWIGDNQFKVWISYYPNISNSQATNLLTQAGYFALSNDVHHSKIALAVELKDIKGLSKLPFVMQLQEMEDPGETENNTARTDHRVSFLQAKYAGAPGYDGTGIVVGHGDDGALGEHVDYTGRLIQSAGNSRGDHGDHVAGTIFGAGNKNPKGEGMAKGAHIYYESYPDNLNNADANFNTQNVRITSSSYSNGCNGGYTNFTRQMDQDAIDRPTMLHVFSAGNSGTSDCGYGAGNNWGNVTGGHKIAKNVIAVANLNRVDGIANSSSRGPASDGRIKPDVGGVGTSVFSTTDLPNAHGYTSKTGTSMSCPGVSGTLATLYEAYKDVHNKEPHAGLLKSILMNTADDLGNNGPDFIYGYGRINARTAYNAIKNSNFISDSISGTSAKNFTLSVPTSGTIKEVKIMLYWPDAPASTIAARALVNDLDLTATQGSSNYQPWVLDPRPNAATLANAAVPARDSLNNVEQITISNPASGDITLSVNPFNLVSSQQKFFITYQFVMDEIVLTYPMGGEGLAPSELEYIRWDASEGTTNFQVEYSTDNGANWAPINNSVPASRRYFAWNVQGTVTDSAIVRVTRGTQSSQSPGVFTIVPVPSGLSIASSCPDSLVLNWNNVGTATGYVIYKLGAEYMDSIGYSSTNSFVVGVNDISKEDWYSVASVTNTGIGRRAIAVQKQAGLINCTLSRDLELAQQISPAPGVLSDCFNLNNLDVTVELYNNGLDSVGNFSLSYQVNSGSIIKDTVIQKVAPGAYYTHTFSTGVTPITGQSYTYTSWINYQQDQNKYNDTLVNGLTITTGTTVSIPYTQNFETFNSCATATNCGATICTLKDGWMNVSNGNGDDIDWRTDNGGTASNNTGPTADYVPGTSNGKYLYTEASGTCEFMEAILVSPCLDLDSTQVSAAAAYFWYHMRGNNMGTLSVDLITENGIVLDIIPQVTGNQGSAWKQANIPLTAYMGQKVAIRIRGLTGSDFASDMAIDAFNLIDPNTISPVADFSFNGTNCAGDTLVFNDLTSGGLASTYNWNFGANATPSTANTAGPHQVVYAGAGTRNVNLVTSNAGGQTSKSKPVAIGDTPLANFNFTLNFNQANFNNSSGNQPSNVSWDFGDGNLSTTVSPTHVYAAKGKYTVTLTVTNACGTDVHYDTVNVTGIVSVEEWQLAQINLFPNPSNGIGNLELGNYNGSVKITIADAGGKQVKEMSLAKNKEESLEINISHAPKGVYFVSVKTDWGTKNFRWLKQE